MTRFLAQRILLAATGGASLLAACGGQVDTKDDSSAAGGSSGASAGSTSQGGSASGQAGTSAGTAGTSAGTAGSVTTGGAGGGKAGTSGSGGGKAGTGGTGMAGSGGCAPGNCPLGQSTCFSLASKALCVPGPDGCGTWQEQPCAPDEKCTGEGQCVPKPPTTCVAGVTCVAGEWCNPDAPAQGGDACTCMPTGAPEKLVCGQPYPWGMTVPVCYDPKGAECLPVAAPELYSTLENRLALSCATIMNGPLESTFASDGTPRCCYDVSIFGCVGRPFVAPEGLRVAEVIRAAAWA